MTFKLINDIKSELSDVDRLLENCYSVTENVDLLTEEADRWIGNVIAALKAGKNPFETIPGSRDLIAGLMLLGDEDNRDGLNIDQKKFDLISKFVDEKDGINKYVAGIAQKHGQSLAKNLEAHVVDGDKRKVLAKKLLKLQQTYSKVKHKVGLPGLTKKSNIAKLA